MPINVENHVYYISFAPYINSLENEVKPNIGQLVLIVLGVFLLYVMNSKSINNGNIKKVKGGNKYG